LCAGCDWWVYARGVAGMKKAIILILLILPTAHAAPVCSDEWTQKDTQYQAVFITLTAVDWLQTKEIARNPRFSETNPLLGGNPSQQKVDIYFTSCILAHTAISYCLPRKYRRIWQVCWIGIEAGASWHNVAAGVRIKF